MKVSLASHAGFCFGVKRALESVQNIKDKDDVYILGELIHNPQEIERLKKKGIKIIGNIDKIKKGTVVISAHGVPDHLIKKAAKKRLKVIDTTCPLVTKVHNIAKDMEKKGLNVVIFGDKNHTEVKGIKGNIKNAVIINNYSDLNKIKKGKLGIVSQTTQDTEKYSNIINKIKEKTINLKVEDTICDATKLRQNSSRELAKRVDLMVVIGGYNSANTKRLAQICSGIVETRRIETEDELKKRWFNGKKHIGVTAGASTPEWVINNVMKKIG